SGQATLVMVEIDQLANAADGNERESARKRALEAMRQVLPHGELIASLGQAVFGVVVGGSSASAALELADAINTRFRAQHVARGVQGARLTLSFGIAEGRGDMAWAAVFSRGEEALGASRAGGGNRIHFHTHKTLQPMLA